MRRTGTALLLMTTLASGGAFAQTATTAQTNAAPVAGSAPMSGSDRFVTDQSVSEFRASKFVGVDVYGTDSQKIGDINEILLDGAGQAKTVVIGVGGFLGIGEKNVAVPFAALEWVNARPTAAAAAPAGGVTGAQPTTPRGETTGSMSPAPAAARTPEEEAAYNGYPDHAMVKLSKADLENAPTFKYYAQTHSASGNAPATPAAKP